MSSEQDKIVIDITVYEKRISVAYIHQIADSRELWKGQGLLKMALNPVICEGLTSEYIYMYLNGKAPFIL